MRIALLTVNAGKGGVVDVVWRLAFGLIERGHDVLIACDHGSEEHRIAGLGARHALVRFDKGPKTFPRARRELSRALRSFRPDVIHSHSRWPSMVCIATGRRPDVSTLHSDQLTAHGGRFDRGPVRRFLSVWGKRVVTLDESARQMLIREFGLAPERIVVAPNSVQTERFNPPTPEERAAHRASLGIGGDDRAAAFVGQLIADKQADWCIRGLRAALDRGVANARLIVTGDGPCQEDLTRLAASEGVSDRCVFTGWRDPRAVYSAADFLALPSRREGFGLVCVEAMLNQRPVLRTRRGGCDQQIIENKTGWSVDPDDEGGFIEKFVEALADPERTASCGPAARRHAIEQFSEHRFVERMLAIYAGSAESGEDPAELDGNTAVSATG